MKTNALRLCRETRRPAAWHAALDKAVAALAGLFLPFAASVVIASQAHAARPPLYTYAWGENIGWLAEMPLGSTGPGLNVGATEVTGYMWGENVGWISFSCSNDSSCATVNYGVTRNPNGSLSGFAWGENIGWISLSCENTDSCASASYRVIANPVTGALSGHAWGENVGWIRFSCDHEGTCRSGPSLTPMLMLLLD